MIVLAEKVTQKSRRLDAGPETARFRLSGLLDHFAEGDQPYLRGTSVPMLIWFAEVSKCRCLQNSSLRDMTSCGKSPGGHRNGSVDHEERYND